MYHEQFQDMLDTLAEKAGVGQEVLGEVLARVSLKAPGETSRVEIAAPNPAARRPVAQRAIAQGTVSKAVKALKGAKFLETGEQLLWGSDGRPLAPIRLGSDHAIAGVKVVQSAEQPAQVMTALFALDGSRVLGKRYDPVGRWDEVAELIHRHVAALKGKCDRARATRGLEPLQMFGVGIEVSSPVYNGDVMPHLSGGPKPPVALATAVHGLLAADARFGKPVPVIVENDVNALAVLAIHQAQFAEADLVVVGVFDEGVGGGLVMDGRLRRGGNGRAMEIGHLAIGFPPGEQAHPSNLPESDFRPVSAELPGFDTACSCGHYGHVDTFASPRRIRGMLGDADLAQLSEIDAGDPQFRRAHEVFARSGAALGRALAHVSNTVNPSRVIAYLPSVLAEPKPGTAAAAYRRGMEQEASNAFAAGDRPGYLDIRSLPDKAEDLAFLGAEAAAACVLESFIEHALRLDGCTTTLRRPNSGSDTGSHRALSPAGQAS